MKDDSNLSYSGELDRLPAWDRAFWLSRAYLEASQCLCNSMIEGEFTSQYSSSRVVLHLMRQGIELFLKAAIERQGLRADVLGHNLDSLIVEYRRAYPEITFFFEIPKRFQLDLNLDLFPVDHQSIQVTMDQRFRYPADRKGESFSSQEIFDPQLVLEEIDELRRVLMIIEYSRIRSSVGLQPGWRDD